MKRKETEGGESVGGRSRRRKRKTSNGKSVLALLGFGAFGLLLWRMLAREETAPAISAADILRRLVIYDDDATPRLTLLREYQAAEKLPVTGSWNLQTAAAAETRLSSFEPRARELLARGIGSDPFFRVAGDLARPN